ncbi:MAG: hypothetical protein A3C15_01120 [Candidatus Magasanikbacteria bacterium RIFCSPHIGHO2_02_FULL_50_9b]|uniref:Uncharacterized protein n=1 Tax=Candidatus Magasanikbacteria bacterium RIFCSPHIGHO2_02_FULL_50_9b TaxID=1798682 RepID=A0A1F6M975_9BACT|nr:MAG: hypothetical protein A3C15_01120 [Candidatus Magasanikbacteria bacterium RIFCSPHIGHO2_02_FULL_50_9b]
MGRKFLTDQLLRPPVARASAHQCQNSVNPSMNQKLRHGLLLINRAHPYEIDRVANRPCVQKKRVACRRLIETARSLRLFPVLLGDATSPHGE